MSNTTVAPIPTGAWSSAPPELYDTYYAVRSGNRPGVYSNLRDLLEAIRGHPYTEFDEFRSLREADQYLCPWFELSRFVPLSDQVQPPDVTVYYVGLASTVQNDATYSCYSVYTNPSSDRNVCQVLLEPISIQSCKLEALFAVTQRLSASAGGQCSKCVLHIPATRDKLFDAVPQFVAMERTEPGSWKAKLAELGSNDPGCVPYVKCDSERNRLEAVVAALAKSPEIEFIPLSPRASYYAARMAFYMAQKAVGVRLNLLQQQQPGGQGGRSMLPPIREQQEDEKKM